MIAFPLRTRFERRSVWGAFCFLVLFFGERHIGAIMASKTSQRRRRKPYEPSRFLTWAMTLSTLIGVLFAVIGVRLLGDPARFKAHAREVPVEIVAFIPRPTTGAKNAFSLKLAATGRDGERVEVYDNYARMRWPYRVGQVVDGYIDDADGRIETPLTLSGASRLGGGLFFFLGTGGALVCGFVLIYDLRNRRVWRRMRH